LLATPPMNFIAARENTGVRYSRLSSIDAATARVPAVCGLAMALVVELHLYTTGLESPALSYAAFGLLALIAVRQAFVLRDALNPLSLLVLLCLIRITMPAILLPHLGSPRGTVIRDFGITSAELTQGLHLATIGLLAVALGWFASPVSWGVAASRAYGWTDRTLRPDRRIVPAAVLVFVAGFVSALIYLAVNFGSPLGAFLSGVARGDSAPGTSRYGFLAVGLLITSAVVLSLYQANRPRASWGQILAPGFLAAVLLTAFGGRIVALTPMALGFIGARYIRRRHEGRAQRRRRRLAVAILLAALAFGYAAFVPQYRGGAGVSALPAALTGSSLRDYAEFTVRTELGTLHPHALAHRLGPGELNGRTYAGVFGAPGQAAGLEGVRPGTYFVEQYGPGGYRSQWGFQTGLVIDTFLNSGLLVMVLACILFGAVLMAEYQGFRRTGATLGSSFLHCFALWTLIWVYFESIVVLPSQLQVGLPVMLLIVLVARLIPDKRLREPRHASAR
jgi:hypothetical protein